MAGKQRAEQWAEHRRQREEGERRQRVMVITEFAAGDPDATMHALAGEILRYRQALRLLAQVPGDYPSISGRFNACVSGACEDAEHAIGSLDIAPCTS
jgi:hypothetical protein